METCNNHQQCIDSAIHRAENVCLKHSMHFTPLRRNILELIWQSHIPLKINDISKQLEQNNQAVKPISVYRVLDFLLEYGMIHKLVSQNSFLGCSHPGEKHNCYFIIIVKQLLGLLLLFKSRLMRDHMYARLRAYTHAHMHAHSTHAPESCCQHKMTNFFNKVIVK